ncbi:WD40 repeat domain-containing serine/threonine protein kinase [Singulisphaera sp. PoT]|uniref:WD40 repeat domain-containing serine/threonine protein kinase n=1 Tax=Singulisphaera sp. PoT TaxID=3411797 RepID=UPI003BF4A7D0
MSAKVPDPRRGHERQGDEPPPAGHPSNPTPESGSESGPPTTLHDSATTEYFTQPSAGENTKAVDSGSGAHRAAAKRPESNAPDSTETAEFDSKALPGNSAPAGEARTAETLPTIRQFLRSIVKLGLISLEDAEPMTEGFADVAELARALVKAGKLTPYQAGAAAHGKSKGLAIGRYIILDRLGAGGMGVVFKAKHRVTARVVALKILLPSLTEKRDAVARFRREAEAAARLNHTNVVSVLDADTDRGVHFLVLDYVEGCDLDRYVRQRGPLSVEQGIDALAQAARGLAAAHGHGIIHRDIKPGNLILDREGTVKVLDLGLAKLIAAANQPTPGWKTGTALTLAHTYMGTVDFMAPEQADDSRSADHRADVYSLGCTIFYLLTGRAPFQAPSILKRLIEHQERPAPSLVEARPETPPSLEALYQSMMAKSPEDRPGSMTEVVSRLEACRQEAARKGGAPATSRMSPPPPAPTPVDPIAAIRLSEDEGSLLPKSGSGVVNDRGRLVSMVASAVVTLTLIIGGFILIPKRGQPPATANAKADPDGADEESKAPEGPSGPAGEKAAPAPVAEDTTPEPLVEVARIHCDDSRTVEAVCVTPDGKTVASTCANGLVQVWDPNTGREVKRLWGPGTVRGMAITRDGRHLLNGDADGKLRDWDLSTGRLIRTTPLIKGRMMALALSRDGRWIAAGGDDADLVLLNGEGREIRRLSAPAAIYSLAFAKDNWHILAGCSNGAVVLFDVAGREKPAVLTPGLPRSDKVPDVAIWGLVVSEDGQYAISAGGEGTARLWDLAWLKEVRKTKLPGGKIRGVCFVSGAPRAVLAVQQGQFTLAGTIATWDYEASVGARPSGRGAAPLGLASMPGGGFASADADGSIRIYAPSRPLDTARRLAAEGKLDEALKHYGEAIQARPRDARLLIERALAGPPRQRFRGRRRLRPRRRARR